MLIKGRCPHCHGDVELKLAKGDGESVGPNPKFPPTWASYGGMKFSDVWKLDKSYIIELSKDRTITGRLKQNLSEFIEFKNTERGGNF